MGDRNLAFFHRFASSKKCNNMITTLIRADGSEVVKEIEMRNLATNFFETLFTSQGVGDTAQILKEVKPIIIVDQNKKLLGKFTGEEIYAALKDMEPTKAPGMDGFPAMFFQKFWNIVGESVTAYCLGVLNDGK